VLNNVEFGTDMCRYRSSLVPLGTFISGASACSIMRFVYSLRNGLIRNVTIAEQPTALGYTAAIPIPPA